MLVFRLLFTNCFSCSMTSYYKMMSWWRHYKRWRHFWSLRGKDSWMPLVSQGREIHEFLDCTKDENFSEISQIFMKFYDVIILVDPKFRSFHVRWSKFWVICVFNSSNLCENFKINLFAIFYASLEPVWCICIFYKILKISPSDQNLTDNATIKRWRHNDVIPASSVMWMHDFRTFFV